MIYAFMLLLTVNYVLKFDLKRNLPVLTRKRAFIFLGIFFTLIAGLRFYVGADTANYVNDFKKIPTLELLTLKDFDFSRYRSGYFLLASLSKTIWDNFLLLQLFVACISNYLIFRFIWKRTTCPFICVLFYLIMNYLEFNFEIMREIVAVSFALIALLYYENGKYIKAITLLILANLMHGSAIIAILYPFITKIRYSKMLIILICFSGLFIISLYKILPDFSIYADLFFNYGNYGERYLSREINQDYNINFYIFHYTKYCFLPIILLLIVKNNFNYVGFVSIWIILGILSIYSYAFYRFNNYFSPFIWLLYAKGVYEICTKYFNVKKAILSFSIVFILFLHQKGLLSIDEHHGGFHIYERYIPYQMVGPEQDYNYNKSDYIVRRGS